MGLKSLFPMYKIRFPHMVNQIECLSHIPGVIGLVPTLNTWGNLIYLYFCHLWNTSFMVFGGFCACDNCTKITLSFHSPYSTMRTNAHGTPVLCTSDWETKCTCTCRGLVGRWRGSAAALTLVPGTKIAIAVNSDIIVLDLDIFVVFE